MIKNIKKRKNQTRANIYTQIKVYPTLKSYIHFQVTEKNWVLLYWVDVVPREHHLRIHCISHVFLYKPTAAIVHILAPSKDTTQVIQHMDDLLMVVEWAEELRSLWEVKHFPRRKTQHHYLQNYQCQTHLSSTYNDLLNRF